VSSSGGTLKGGQTYYFAVTAMEEEIESTLSFLVRATVPPGGDTNAVTLEKLSFAPVTTSFNVYRGNNPLQLLRIASQQDVAATFTDDGMTPQALSPPDPNFHHANFYWRLELQPETAASIHTPNTIGDSSLGMNPNEYRGKIVRITEGKAKDKNERLHQTTRPS